MVSAIQRFHCIKNKLLDTEVDSLKTASEKVVDETGELLGKRFAVVAVTNSYDNKIVKTKPVEEVIVPPEKKEAIILNKLRQVL